MNLNIQKVIEKLGYKRKEAQLYIAALVLGEAKVSDLAEKLKIPRTSAVVTIEKLHKEGLLNYYVKRFNKYWVAESPDKLVIKLQEEEANLIAALPAIKAMQPRCVAGKPTSKTYVGKDEIKQIFEDIILSKHNIRAIIAWNDLVDLFGASYIEYFIETQVGHFLKLRLMTPQSPAATALRGGDAKENRETRFLSKHTTSLNTATILYGNKVAIISLNKTLPTGFLVEDIDVHNTMAVFFEELWNTRT